MNNFNTLILLENFNNYFNRRIFKYSEVEDYTNASSSFFSINNYNFNPQDGVATKIIINEKVNTCDYLLVLEEDTIISRWFIIKTDRLRNGQYELAIRRDVIADKMEKLFSSPLFVQKGIISDDDPLIVNDEGMSFNQIKTSETLLKDKSGCGWLVGYIAKNIAETSNVQATIKAEDVKEYYTLSQIASSIGTTEEILNSIINLGNSQNYPSFFTKQLNIYFPIVTAGNTNRHRIKTDGEITATTQEAEYTVNINDVTQKLFNFRRADIMLPYDIDQFRAVLSDKLLARKDQLKSELPSYLNRNYYLTTSQLEKLKEYEGKYILYYGSYYKLSFQYSGTEKQTAFHRQAIKSKQALYNITTDVWIELPEIVNYFPDTGVISLEATHEKVFIQLLDTQAETEMPSINGVIPTSRSVILDQQFDIFSLPYGSFEFIDEDGNSVVNNPETNLKIANELIKEMSNGCYDFQLLPFCPVLGDLTNDGKYDTRTKTLNQDFSLIKTQSNNYNRFIYSDNLVITSQSQFGLQVQATIQLPRNIIINSVVSDGTPIIASISYTQTSYENYTELVITGFINASSKDGSRIKINYDGNENVGLIVFPKSASFQTILDYKLELKDSMKIESNCSMYRLVSPNYQGSFEFNVAKNGGSVEYFTAYCTYKPYTPFIKIVPTFSWLYGIDFNDNRGLICGGDFSLPRISSAWETYQLNNKNYQNIFNREIQSLDFHNQIAQRNQVINAVVGTVQGTASGAMTGALVGGGIGAVVGGVIGGASSLVGGIVDTDTLAREQREQRQLAVDKYNYNLGNVKALPNTLTKVGAFDISSKVFPFLEYFTCTEEEKENFIEKLNYESYTVMKIDLMGNYIHNDVDNLHYLKGALIRNLEISNDAHFYEEIANELLKGVFI